MATLPTFSRIAKPPRAIFFDAGNTLLEINYAAIQRCLGPDCQSADMDAVRRAECFARVKLDPHLAPGSSTESDAIFTLYITYLLEGLGIREPRVITRISEELRGYNPPVGLWEVANPDAPVLLEDLARRRVELGVISNSNGSVRSILEATGLARHMRCILDSRIVGAEKPNPEIFHLALRTCGVGPHEAVYIGDLYSVDVLGARGVGMQAILLDPIGAWGDLDCLRATTLQEAVRLALGTESGC
jgi:putative hydrolase of the HAD superfamily